DYNPNIKPWGYHPFGKGFGSFVKEPISSRNISHTLIESDSVLPPGVAARMGIATTVATSSPSALGQGVVVYFVGQPLWCGVASHEPQQGNPQYKERVVGSIRTIRVCVCSMCRQY